jgi:hypothetical protein
MFVRRHRCATPRLCPIRYPRDGGNLSSLRCELAQEPGVSIQEDSPGSELAVRPVGPVSFQCVLRGCHRFPATHHLINEPGNHGQAARRLHCATSGPFRWQSICWWSTVRLGRWEERMRGTTSLDTCITERQSPAVIGPYLSCRTLSFVPRKFRGCSLVSHSSAPWEGI